MLLDALADPADTSRFMPLMRRLGLSEAWFSWRRREIRLKVRALFSAKGIPALTLSGTGGALLASLMVAAGVPIFDVAKILGHSTIAVTMRYAHFAPAAGRGAIDALDRQLRPAGAPPGGLRRQGRIPSGGGRSSCEDGPRQVDAPRAPKGAL